MKVHACLAILSVAIIAETGLPRAATAQEAPPPRGMDLQPTGRWSDSYGGLVLGAGWIDADVQGAAGGREFELSGLGFTGGALVGRHIAAIGLGSSVGQLLFGGEAELTHSTASDSQRDPTLGVLETDSSLIASLRLRGGYAWRKYYLYGTVGPAVSDMGVEAATGGNDDFKIGLSYGLGVEVALDKMWSLRLEGLSYEFGDDNVTLSGANRNVETSSETIRLGISYKF